MRGRTKLDDRRGSVIILVVVAIGLMAFIGATYLQVARVQRQVVAQPVNNIELVLQSVRQEIATQLKEDIFDAATGNYFDVAAGIEPYDRAMVNTTATYPVFGIDGATQVDTANGGSFDDTWLASSTPYDADPTVAEFWTWRKLTTLTGGFYNTDGTPDRYVRDGASAAGPDRVGGTPGVDYTNEAGGPAEVIDPFNDPDLVDADADGMGDSRWERAPIALKDGVEYFMAVRVIDPSAFLNVNVATASVTGYPGTPNRDDAMDGNAPRGIYPSELDLEEYIDQFTTGESEIADLLGNYRGLPDSGWPAREGFWLDAGRRLGNPTAGYRSLTAAEEAELRYRGGAYDLPELSGELEARLGATVMADSTADLGTDGIGSHAEAGLHYGYGNKARPRLTAVSAEAMFAPLLPGETRTERLLRFPLNDARLLKDDDATVGRAAPDPDRDAALVALAAAVESVYASFPGATLPGGFPNNAAGLRNFSLQFAASLQDFRDADNRLTVIDPDGDPTSGDELVGMEALPVITEVYVHQPYTFSPDNLIGADLDGDADDPDFEGTWSREAGRNPSFAIEVRNPFNRTISLQNVFLDVAGVTPTSVVATDVNGDGLIDLAELTGHPDLIPGEVLILYRNDGATHGVVNTTDFLFDANGIALRTPHVGADQNYRGGSATGGAFDDWFSLVMDEPAWRDRNSRYPTGFGDRGYFSYVPIDLPIAGEWPNTVDPSIPQTGGGQFNGALFSLRLAAATTVSSGLLDLLTYQEFAARAMPDQFDERWTDYIVSPTDGPVGLDGITAWAAASARSNGYRLNALMIPRADLFHTPLDAPSTLANGDARLDVFHPYKRYLPPSNAVTTLGAANKASALDTAGVPAMTNRNRVGPDVTPGNVFGPGLSGNFLVYGTTGTGTPFVRVIWYGEENPATTSGDPSIAFVDQWMLPDRADNRIDSTAELVQLVIAGPSLGQTVAERLDAALVGKPYTMAAMRIDPEATDAVGPAPASGGQVAWDVNHAEFLLQRLTTFSPSADGVDNNGDGTIDEPGEQAVPGRINLHAADRDLWTDVLPYRTPNLYNSAADDLVRYGSGLPADQPGVPHIWRQYRDPASQLKPEYPGTLNSYFFDGTFVQTRYDFLHNEEGLLNGSGPRDFTLADTEDLMLYMNRLPQVATTRSDVYVAYVLVHGYKSGEFVDGPVEVGREIVLFDRTGLVTNDDAVVSSVLYRFP